MVDWLTGIGLSFEVAGGALLVFPILAAPRWSRGMLFPSGGPTREALQEVAYAEAGLLILIAGFVLQLAGYVTGAETWWTYLLVVMAVVVTVFVGGGFLAGRVLLPILYRLAIAEYRTTEAYRQQREAEERLDRD
jgi:hypothetical protein